MIKFVVYELPCGDTEAVLHVNTEAVLLVDLDPAEALISKALKGAATSSWLGQEGGGNRTEIWEYGYSPVRCAVAPPGVDPNYDSPEAVVPVG